MLRGGQWVSPISRRSYAAEEVALAVHHNDPPDTPPGGWHAYTEAQLAVTLDVCLTLVHHYALIDVLGHDDIAPLRKRDPGPAFPMASVRARVLACKDDATPCNTPAALNVRGDFNHMV